MLAISARTSAVCSPRAGTGPIAGRARPRLCGGTSAANPAAGRIDGHPPVACRELRMGRDRSYVDSRPRSECRRPRAAPAPSRAGVGEIVFDHRFELRRDVLRAELVAEPRVLGQSRRGQHLRAEPLPFALVLHPRTSRCRPRTGKRSVRGRSCCVARRLRGGIHSRPQPDVAGGGIIHSARHSASRCRSGRPWPVRSRRMSAARIDE